MVNRFIPGRDSRILGCWLGKSIGGTLGLPAEGKTQRLNFSFYDPVPVSAPPNDDLELQLVWLYLVESSADTLSTADFARAWLRHIHYMWDEYGRCRWNLRRGVPAECAGIFENPFHAAMGSPIRSEIWACLFIGDPDSAAHYAALDASLDHGVEGIAGEVLFAAMQSKIAGESGLEEAIDGAVAYIPAGSETARAVAFVRQCHRDDVPEWEAWKELVARHATENFTHAPLNVALTIWALLYGNEDFEKTVLLAVNGGYDTDCTAATAGATLGLMLGAEKIPARWIEPIGEGVFVGKGILEINAPPTLTELSRRTAALAGKLRHETWDGSFWTQSRPHVDLATLPGTIFLAPADGSAPVPWANGELPVEIKRAGGGSWSWKVTVNGPRLIICLVRAGARLFLDGQLLIECPAGLPYVPASHRTPAGSRIRLESPAPGVHEMRLELNRRDAAQDASVILAYPNEHLAPWTASELPEQALLP
jgi:ADP-ribosylglycohydrolase